MMKYIHYGHKNFVKAEFKPIRNAGYEHTKPEGGFWASAEDAKFGWKDWCAAEEFCECKKENSFTFSLSDDARVLHICSVEQLEALPKQKSNSVNPRVVRLDFEKLKDSYDAIQVTISNDRRLYYALFCWDCDCILIMNPDIVVPAFSFA